MSDRSCRVHAEHLAWATNACDADVLLFKRVVTGQYGDGLGLIEWRDEQGEWETCIGLLPPQILLLLLESSPKHYVVVDKEY